MTRAQINTDAIFSELQGHTEPINFQDLETNRTYFVKDIERRIPAQFGVNYILEVSIFINDNSISCELYATEEICDYIDQIIHPLEVYSDKFYFTVAEREDGVKYAENIQYEYEEYYEDEDEYVSMEDFFQRIHVTPNAASAA